MSRFEIRDQFYLDNAPFQIISGAMHYFRVVPAYWRDRLLKLRAMGCNTVETYVPWNLHEPQKGALRFGGGLDLRAFLETAQAVGLYAIVRPSPFICAEWEFGGLPAWLLAGEDMPLRSSQGPFLSHVADYYRRLFQEITPMQVDNGGNVILMQVENEFGAWGESDPDYLARMADLMRENGAVVPFITSDNLENNSLDRGAMDGALATVNFGSGAAEKLEILRPYAKGGPLMVTEFWDGWFDAWGDKAHHTAAPTTNAADLDVILSKGSVNIYMFHGGTNFGFMNGSNYYDRLTPDVTSYDYDAPLTEDGWATPKYQAFREVIAKHAPIPQLSIPFIPRCGYGTIACAGRAGLLSAPERLTNPIKSTHPRSMERFQQGYGYILYRRILSECIESIEFQGANDRVQVYVDGVCALTLYDLEIAGKHDLTANQGAVIDILVENMGRVNYGKRMASQRKGIDGAILLNATPATDWEIYTLPMEDLSGLVFDNQEEHISPAFFRFLFPINTPSDTFLDLNGWGKGCAFLNGVNLGRFWAAGPQKRLYIPAPLLKTGENELILFETEGVFTDYVTLAATPDLG